MPEQRQGLPQRLFRKTIHAISRRYPDQVNAAYSALRNNPEVIALVPAITFFVSSKKLLSSLMRGDLKASVISGVSAALSIRSLMSALDTLETINKYRHATPIKMSEKELDELAEKINEAIADARREGKIK